MKFHVAPLPSCSGTRMSESLCRCTFYLRLKLLATKLHHLSQITKSVFGRLLFTILTNCIILNLRQMKALYQMLLRLVQYIYKCCWYITIQHTHYITSSCTYQILIYILYRCKGKGLLITPIFA